MSRKAPLHISCHWPQYSHCPLDPTMVSMKLFIMGLLITAIFGNNNSVKTRFEESVLLSYSQIGLIKKVWHVGQQSKAQDFLHLEFYHHLNPDYKHHVLQDNRHCSYCLLKVRNNFIFKYLFESRKYFFLPLLSTLTIKRP